MTPRDLLQGTALMVAVVLIWGAFLPVSKSALRVIDPYWLSTLRYALASAAFALLLVRVEGARKLSPRGYGLKLLVFGSGGLAGFSILVFEGARLTRPEHGAMILALNPVWIALWQWWRTGRRPHAATLACIALALLGEALVVSRGDPARLVSGGSALGNLLVLLAAFCWTAYTLGAQQLRGFSPVRYTVLTGFMGWGSIVAVTLLATAAGHAAPPPPAALMDIVWELVFIVAGATFASILWWNMAVVKIGPLNAALFAAFAPVITFMIAAWQGQSFTPVEVLGAALVVAALAGNNLAARRLLASARSEPQL